jgi:hypothetical protein
MDLGIESIIKDLVKDFATATIDKTLELGSKQYKKILVTLELCFSKYLERSYSRYSKIKTLLYRDRPVDLKAHYVSTDFKLGDNLICGKDIFEKFQECNRNIVVGTAGSGKSVLLRRLFIDLVENPKGVIPVLIELRLLETPENKYSILEFIHKTLSDLNEEFTLDQLHFALKEGKIALFLDGFDEIDFEKRGSYEREILDLSNKYLSSVIVISSRPDDGFSSWGEFHVFRAMRLNKEQSVDLISRIEYDKTVKEKFIKELKSGLYDRHRDFLSNPLLLTMMLLTYEQLAEIPEKIHIFYEQAFDTLYHKHDALKSLYKRKSFSGLPIDDFKKIFSAFCIVTYSDRKMSFSYHEIISYIDKAIQIEDVNVKSYDMFNDLIKSVCIIQKDGNIFTFSHRSFQEYFAAYFISKSQSLDTGKILDTIVKSHFRDNVINMLFELNRDLIETKWIIPRLQNSLSKCKASLDNHDTMGFLSVFYEAFSLHDDGIGLQFSDKSPLGHFSSGLHRLYRNESDIYFKNDVPEEETAERRRKELDIFLTHVESKDPNQTILFSDLTGDVGWLSETWIPEYCEKKYKLMEHLHKMLSDKYSEKESSLNSLLLN